MFIVHLAGHLGKDPETRFTANGQKVTSFSMAINQRKGKEDVTVWVRVTIWGDRFDKMISFLKKGSAIMVTGRMNPPTTYVDKEGRTQVSLEVTAEMLEFSPFGKTDRADGQQQGTQSNFNQYNQQAQAPAPSYAPQGGHEPPYYNKPASQPYGGNYAVGGGEEHSHSMEDDDLPF
jgi:single-strand DNA-binding protein